MAKRRACQQRTVHGSDLHTYVAWLSDRPFESLAERRTRYKYKCEVVSCVDAGFNVTRTRTKRTGEKKTCFHEMPPRLAVSTVPIRKSKLPKRYEYIV